MITTDVYDEIANAGIVEFIARANLLTKCSSLFFLCYRPLQRIGVDQWRDVGTEPQFIPLTNKVACIPYVVLDGVLHAALPRIMYSF